MPQLSGPPPVPGANYATGGCGPRPLLSGAVPSWTASARPPALIYVLGRGRQSSPMSAASPPVTLSSSANVVGNTACARPAAAHTCG